MSIWNPKRRYSAVAVMSEDLERVVLIHKLTPAWQAGKANVPGGKVDAVDWGCTGWCGHGNLCKACQVRLELAERAGEATKANAHLACAARELREETGLDIAATTLQLFCRLRFKSREGDDAECCFYATVVLCKGRDLDDHVKTMEAEQVFCAWFSDVVEGEVQGPRKLDAAGLPYGDFRLPAMPNLPYLVAMARQCLRGEGASAWPLTVYENGATL